MHLQLAPPEDLYQIQRLGGRVYGPPHRRTRTGHWIQNPEWFVKLALFEEYSKVLTSPSGREKDEIVFGICISYQTLEQDLF